MRATKTYQIVTPESAEDGVFADHGFVYENEQTSVDDFMHEMGDFVEPCAFPYTVTDLKHHFFFTDCDPELDYETGANTYHTYHIDQISDLERLKLWILLQRARTKRWERDDAAM